MKIAVINTTHKKYGGTEFETRLTRVLSNTFEVEFVNVGVRHKNNLKYLETFAVLWRLFKSSRRNDFDVVIRNFEASLFLNKQPTRNVALVHHIDSSRSPGILRIIYPCLEKLVLSNLRNFDAIVVVSKYWEDFFRKKGYKNVHIIYNPFDLREFNFSSLEIFEFKKKYKLLKKPILYIGNALKKKGVVESYNVLKDLDVHLVTSGKSQVEIPAINLNLDHKEYLKLLKATSVVVTMSKFKEGWCRTAHEAMLCKTPVVGSGTGGMRELLEGGKQIICNDFKELKNKVEFAMQHPELGEKGYNFAKIFTIEKFKKEWVNLINSLSE